MKRKNFNNAYIHTYLHNVNMFSGAEENLSIVLHHPNHMSHRHSEFRVDDDGLLKMSLLPSNKSE